ncbi:MAG: hypothetical protein PHV93_04570 [Candidatus Pacebacteria bacterium]|nr:hypothetical protein [Candidatus Paceibacterota bacterium]
MIWLQKFVLKLSVHEEMFVNQQSRMKKTKAAKKVVSCMMKNMAEDHVLVGNELSPIRETTVAYRSGTAASISASKSLSVSGVGLYKDNP